MALIEKYRQLDIDDQDLIKEKIAAILEEPIYKGR